VERDAWPEKRLVPYETSVFSARTVLVLAPHPDDEVFGCGAAIASLREAGASVTVAIATDGAGTEPDPATRRRIGEGRVAESRAALAILGGAEVEALGFPDRGLSEAGEPLRAALARRLAPAPDLVLLPSPVEVHPDHRALAEAFLTLEVPAATTVAFYELSQPIRPNFLLDASRFAERKARAMAAFVSQNQARDYPGFVTGLNTYRRMTLPAEVTSAEAYWVTGGADLGTWRREALRAAIGPTDVDPAGRSGPMTDLWRWLTDAWRGPA
jgi:LmbE family N-acetylglucosaminyl deacetylase